MARSDSRRAASDAAGLPSRKSRELGGLVLASLALLLLLSLLSYHPQDPSLFHRSSDSAATDNWIGPAGAEVAALCFNLAGLAALLLPLVLAGVAWQLLRQDTGARIVGRRLGVAILVVGFPVLIQLVLGRVTWRGESMNSGGVFGYFFAGALESRLHFVGSLLVLASLMAVGATLALQSSLDQLIGTATARSRGRWQSLVLALTRSREKREKEKARRRVVAKHLERARERRAERKDMVSASVTKASRQHEPLRVRVVRRGTEEIAERVPPEQPPMVETRVRATAPEPEPEVVQSRESRDQQRISFPKGRGGSRGKLPPLNLLDLEKARPTFDEDELVRLGDLICDRCAEFGVEGTIQGITPGPVITVFEFQPAPGVKVSRIVSLQDELALALKAESIRIERLPGRSTLGIEVPNPSRAVIHLGSLLADPAFKKAKSPLTMALGQNLYGENYYVDLAAMPHLLVAGATGSGKSVGLQSMITSILYKATRDQVQFIFIDPKRIELGVYADIPHLKTEVVVEPKKAANALRWAVAEMERRYRLLAEVHVRSIDFYNRAIGDPEVQKRLALREDDDESALSQDDLAPLPYYVIVIDELADLMMVASSEVETCIARIAQMARAVGIHLIVATQRPSVDVLTGMIKANFPCRIAYATASRHDSRTILDNVGAERLLGRGDALFMPPTSSRIMRLHGAYVSEQETAALIRWLKKQGKPELDPEVLAPPVEERGGGSSEPDDDLYDEAARLVVAEGKASASFLQRRMRIGFSRAARLIDMMEQDGLLGPSQGSKPREILVKADYFEELDNHQ